MFLMPGMIITLYTTGVLDSVLRWAGSGGAGRDEAPAGTRTPHDCVLVQGA